MQNRIFPVVFLTRSVNLSRRFGLPHPCSLTFYQNRTNFVHPASYLTFIVNTTPGFNYSLLSRHSFHTTCQSTSKEPSKIEETVKVLKETENKVAPATPKRTIIKRITDELVHYYHGFRLLFIDIRISSRLLWKVLNGNELTRREHRQLIRTVSDMFRLVPFSIFLIVPFMEFLLPVFIKFFPSMLPSTFATKSDKEMKFKKNLRIKIEMAKFLQETLDEMALKSKGESHSENAKKFSEFFQKIRTTGEVASNEEIMKFSKLFEDEITLDSLSRPQLTALCRLLELKPLGTNNFLRFQLRNRIRSLRADDRVIMKEGLDSMTIQEVQAACRARGMRALGLPEERLRAQLQSWLELSLTENIPPSLLLLSRALYLPEQLPATDQLKATLSTLSDTAAAETKFKIGEMEGKVDNKTKLQLIKLEEEQIKKEAEELKQQLIIEQNEEKQKEDSKTKEELGAAQQADKDILIDKAAILEDKAAVDITATRELKEAKEEELSKEDFEELENALENIATEKNKLLIEKEEIEDLKEEMAEYQEDIAELKDTLQETGTKEVRESKAALRLSKKVNKMISKMDGLINNLHRERDNLEQQIDSKVKEGAEIGKERDDIVDINELVLAIRRIQKVSDDTRLQRIADVLEKMDIDHDGAVEIDHVLKAIELMGKDNVKVSSKQMDDIIELLMKEDSLELEEKIQKQKQRDDKENGATGKEKQSQS